MTISSGDHRIISLHAPWINALGAASIFLLLASFMSRGQPPTATPPLRGASEENGLYFIGNSMFGTGLDIELVQRLLPSESASLAYYDGHYTNMWYSAFRNGLIPSGARPKVVVWGFRPTYAVYPAFRQNRETELEKFHDADDVLFSSILNPANDGQSITPPSTNPDFYSIILEYIPFLQERDKISRIIKSNASRKVSAAYAGTNATASSYLDPANNLKLADVVVSFTSGGEVTRADALVVDNGERFVNGAAVTFDNSFIPPTIDLLRKENIPQLIVIFKPVSVFDGKMGAPATSYYQDAVNYLRAEGIPYIDFVADDGLTKDLYAKGDHYTREGMTYVTEKIVDKLAASSLVGDVEAVSVAK